MIYHVFSIFEVVNPSDVVVAAPNQPRDSQGDIHGQHAHIGELQEEGEPLHRKHNQKDHSEATPHPLSHDGK